MQALAFPPPSFKINTLQLYFVEYIITVNKRRGYHMLSEDRKYFNGIRFFALFALLCTIVLWLGLWCASATPGEISGADTDALTDRLDSKYDVSSKFDSKDATQNFVLGKLKDATFIGDKEKCSVTFYPHGATDRELVYESANEKIATVDENGVVTLVGFGETKITARLKSNPSIYNYCHALCLGVSPKDCNPPTMTAVNPVIKEGQSVSVKLNGGKTSPNAATFTSSDENVAIAKAGIISGRKQGSATITARYKDGTEVSCDVTVVADENYVKPSRIALKTLSVSQGQVINIYDFLDNVEPKNAPTGCIAVSSDTSVASLRGENLHFCGHGAVTLTYTSRFVESVSASITLVVNKIKPTDFRVSGPSVTTPNVTCTFSAQHLPYPYRNDVKWEIVKGKHATINEKGQFKATFFGKYVVRCTSILDSSLCVEKTIEVKLFSTAYGFVRKFMGHMGLSLVLGFGLFYSCLFFCKQKWKCAVYPLALSLVHALVSEGIQYFTPSRFCTFADVITDFAGGIFGILFGAVLLGLILLVWRLISKKSFEKITHSIKILCFKNCLKKTYKFDAEYQRDLNAE